MPTITPDVVYNSEVDIGPTGGFFRRVFSVEGMPVTPDVLFQAIALVKNGGYSANIGDVHPQQAGLFAARYGGKPQGTQESPSRNNMYVFVTYYTPDVAATSNYTMIEVGGSNAQEIISVWQSGPIRGQPMVVGYQPPQVLTSPGMTQGETQPLANLPYPITPDDIAKGRNNGQFFDTIQIPVESPNRIIRFTRREPQCPVYAQYHRRINSTPFLGFPAGTVLCRNIEGKNIVGGGIVAPSEYIVVYTFEYNPQPYGWLHFEFFIDHNTGKPEAGVDVLGNHGKNNGYTIVQPYDSADFNGLKLPNLDSTPVVLGLAQGAPPIM